MKMRQHMRTRCVCRFHNTSRLHRDFVHSPLLFLADERPPQDVEVAFVCARRQIPHCEATKFARRISRQPRCGRIREDIVSVVVGDQRGERQSIDDSTEGGEWLFTRFRTRACIALQTAKNFERSGACQHPIRFVESIA